PGRAGFRREWSDLREAVCPGDPQSWRDRTEHRPADPGSAAASPAGNSGPVVLWRNRSRPDTGPAVEQPPVAVLGGTNGDGLPALRRRQGSKGLVRLQSPV